MSNFIAVNSIQSDQPQAPQSAHPHPDTDSITDTPVVSIGGTYGSHSKVPQSEVDASEPRAEASGSNLGPTELITTERTPKKRKRDADLESQSPRKASKISMSLKIKNGVAVSASIKQTSPPASLVFSSLVNEPAIKILNTTTPSPLGEPPITSPPYIDGLEQIVDRLRTVAGTLRTNKRVVMPSNAKGKKKSDLWVLLQQACGELDEIKVLAEEIEGITRAFLQRERDLKQREQQIAEAETRLRQESLVAEWLAEQQEGVLLEAAQKGIELAGSVRFELHVLREQLRIGGLNTAANDCACTCLKRANLTSN